MSFDFAALYSASTASPGERKVFSLLDCAKHGTQPASSSPVINTSQFRQRRELYEHSFFVISFSSFDVQHKWAATLTFASLGTATTGLPSSTTRSRLSSTASRWSLLSSAATGVAGLQALLSASTIGAGIASWAVAVKRAATSAAISLLSITARLVSLRLIQVGSTVLRLHVACPALLIQSRLVPAFCLLIELSRVSPACFGTSNLLLRTLVAELRLIIFLVELGFCEVGVARIGAKVIGTVVVDVIAIDVRSVDIVAVDVRGIDVVPVVVIVAVDEGVRIGNIDVAVVNHSRAMPTAPPRVPAPSAT